MASIVSAQAFSRRLGAVLIVGKISLSEISNIDITYFNVFHIFIIIYKVFRVTIISERTVCQLL